MLARNGLRNHYKDAMSISKNSFLIMHSHKWWNEDGIGKMKKKQKKTKSKRERVEKENSMSEEEEHKIHKGEGQ